MNKTTFPEIRVFLSSTFRDMEVERIYLIKQVFPKVRATCHARQVGFTEIDLRWGVSEKESQNGATIEICLKEIDRCRDFPPFFIGFLGERYGWIPRHDELAAYWQEHAESPYAASILDAVKRGISVTELEMELAVLAEGAAEKIAGNALFLLRDQELTDSYYQAKTGKDPDPSDPAYYDAAEGKLDALKARIRSTPFLGIDGYSDVEQFGQAIEDYLLGQLDLHFPEEEIPTPLQRMQVAHSVFRFHRLQNFLLRADVRQTILDAMVKRLDTPVLGPILVAGPSGQGKSVIMADLARHLETEQGDIHWRVIDHYIGADSHNTLESWLGRLLETLHPEIEDLTGPLPESSKERKEVLSTWLDMAARRMEQQSGDPRPVRYALVVDALDQLMDGGKDLDLLKLETIGPDTVLIVSAADDTKVSQAAATYETVVVPPLTSELKTRFIQNFLAQYRKNPATELISTLAAAPQSDSPLFLTLALEELRLDARHETLDTLLKEILTSPDAQRLFLNRFLLDDDNTRPEQPDLAVRFMALLGASHNGLTPQELAELLALPSDPIDEHNGKPRLPQIHLSRLLVNFSPFLISKQGNRAPMHRIFGEAALADAGETVTRQYLYDVFRPGYGTGWDDIDTRQSAEALYQVTQLADIEPAMRQTLLDDLGQLWVPATLGKAEAVITQDALEKLDDAEREQLTHAWQSSIDQAVENTILKFHESIAGFAWWLNNIVYGRYQPTRKLLESLLHRQEGRPDGDDLILARNLNLLGWVCSEMADYTAGRLLFERALAIWEKALGSEHPDVGFGLRNLAIRLESTGDADDFAAARQLYERALAIFEKAQRNRDQTARGR